MKKLILALGIITPSLLFGQVDRSKVPSPAPAKEISIADPVVFKTTNGITVILSENHKIPTVRFSLTMGGEQRLEGNKAGLASLAGDLILSGTSNMPKDQIDSKIDYIGASLYAGSRYIGLSCLTKHMDTGLKILSDVLQNANFPQDEFDRIVKQNENGLMSAKSDPNTMGSNALMSSMFVNHPYGEVMTETTLHNITREDVMQYYKQTFVPQGSYLVIVGDINKEQAEKTVNKYFSTWTGNMLADETISAAKKLTGNRVVFVKKPGAVQSFIQVAFPIDAKVGDENYIPLNLTNHIFGGNGFGTRLMQNLREDKAYTYGSYSSLSINPLGSYISARGNFRNEVTDSAIVQLLFELDSISNSYVSDEELSLAKAVLNGRFARSLEDASTIARFALNIQRYELNADYYKNYLKNLDAVTKEKVLDIAQNFYTANNCFIVVVGNEEVIDKLKRFDSDGKIEIVDAFGKAVQEMKKADITAEELFKRHSFYVTNTTSTKKRDKVLKKLKSVKQEVEITMSQAPFPMKSIQFWGSPNSEVMTIEAQGMVVQKTFFDGKTGYASNMRSGKTEMTAEEITAKNKSVGYIPELNYDETGMTYELLGIENQDGKDVYVVKLNDGENEMYSYYDKKSYQKVKHITIPSDPKAGGNVTITYNDYKNVEGLMISHKMVLQVGEMALNGEVKTVAINEAKISDFAK